MPVLNWQLTFMCTMEQANRQRIANLLCVGMAVKNIAGIVRISLPTVYAVKKRAKEGGSGFEGAVGSGTTCLIWNDAFLDAQEEEIAKRPNKPMCKLAREAGVDEKTIRMAVHKGFGLKSCLETAAAPQHGSQGQQDHLMLDASQLHEVPWLHKPTLLGQEGLDSGPGPQCPK